MILSLDSDFNRNDYIITTFSCARAVKTQTRGTLCVHVSARVH